MAQAFAIFLRFLFLVTLCLPDHARGDSSSFDEYQVKALYLYHFSTFVSWPAEVFEDLNTPIRYCVFGTDPFGDTLDKVLIGERIRGRTLAIRRCRDVGEVPSSCHILFISRSEEDRLGDILRAVEGLHVLTVGDMDGFAQQGGIINLARKGSRIHVVINLHAAGKAGIHISSKLLKLATIIEGEQGNRFGHATIP